jgi:DNA-binding beta-propeller fold protein YncE
VSAIAAQRMARRLTVPFERGADSLTLAFQPGATAGRASFAAYDFVEHRARFGTEPEPRYVLVARRDVDEPMEVTVTYEVVPSVGAPTPGAATVKVPGGTVRGTSVAIDLSPHEGPATLLRALTVTPPTPAGTVSDAWSVTALLATTAKLLWVTGWERDALRTFLDRVRSQRDLGQAVGHTLDLFGYDLGVPRFPPRPYAFEDGTVALYHLDDPPGGPVRDTMSVYGGVGHPSTSVTAAAGAPGRFGTGFAFRDPGAQILVGHHAEFALGATASFTAELFVKPDDGEWEGDVLSKHADLANSAMAGWAISVGSFRRGIPRNVRFLVADGTAPPVVLFADIKLATAGFHHVAGVIDRAAQQARLWVDGELRAVGAIGGLAALTNAEPVRMGRAGAGAAVVFQGVLDEVRLSRAARNSFHPILGENDESCRRRLRIFRRWTLPTAANLQAALNEVVDTVAGVPDPFVVDDTDATVAGGAWPMRIFPVELAPASSLDAAGHRDTAEADAVGTPSDDPGFDPLLLVSEADPRAVFSPAPAPEAGPLVADARRMRPGTRRVLRAIIDELSARGVPGPLHVVGGFDPDAADLRSVGRALLLTHPTLDLGRLAVVAHRVGASWVQYRADEAVVYAAVESKEIIDIDVVGGTATPENGFDLLVGQDLQLRVAPPLPNDATYRWSTVACGAGVADFPDQRVRPQTTIRALRPGYLAVEVQVNLGVRAFTAMLRLRIGVADVPANTSIAADGTLGASEAVAGDPADGFFDPAYLVTYDDPRITYASAADARRMQPAIAERLTRLLDLIGAAGVAGAPQLASSWTRDTADLAGVGRALTLATGTLTVSLPRLGALAHAAGFTLVRNDGTRLQLRQAAGDPVTVSGPEEAEEGTAVKLSVTQRAAPAAVALAGTSLFSANAGTDTVSAIDTRDGRVRWVAKVGAQPTAMAVAPGGTRVFSADRGSRTLTALDAGTGAIVGTVALTGTPSAVAHHPSSPALFVALPGDDRVVRVDTSTLTVSGTAAVAGGPVAVVVHPSAPQVWVATDGGATVRIVNASTLVVSAPIALPGPATDIAMNATRAYVCVPSAPALVVLDVATRTVQGTFTDLGPAPDRVAVTPDGSTVYVTDTDEGRLYVRAADGSAKPAPTPASVPTGQVPADLVADDSRAYVADRASGPAAGTDAISVLDAARLTLATVWALGTGHGERLIWSVQTPDVASARLSSTTAPEVNLAVNSAGRLLVHVAYLWRDHTPPYSFQVRLNPELVALEQAGTPVVIRKDHYDLVMNVLNELHPIGVEVDTRIVREHVVELRDSLLDVFPGYTFPRFRLRGTRPAITPIGTDEDAEMSGRRPPGRTSEGSRRMRRAEREGDGSA